MKIQIEVNPDITEEVITISCREINESILSIQKLLTERKSERESISLTKEEKQYYIPLKEILFFETSNRVISAHTVDDYYNADYKLYELEEILPGYFMRVSKSTILNIDAIYTITKNLTSFSTVEFRDTNKQVFVSRHYYKALYERMEERRIRG